MGLGRDRPARDHHDGRPVLAGQHRPGRHQDEQPEQDREVRVPRVGQHVQSVPADRDRSHGCDRAPLRASGEARTDRDHPRHCDHVDHRAAELHAPR
jgi:hypothetical protein